MTTTDERAAFLASIRADPADDLVRLVYADWLDEHGESDRAEFIRVQCESAGSPGLTEVRRDELTRRERELWRANHGRWFGDGTGANCFGSCLTPNAVDPRVRRGFVGEVRLPTDAFLAHAPALFAAHPIAEVRLIDRVSLDYGPWGVPYRFAWVPVDRHPGVIRARPGAPHLVPWELYREIKGGHRSGVIRWETRAGADNALSRACVDYGRSLAGLPPL